MNTFIGQDPSGLLNLVFGTRAVREAILAGRTIERVFFQKNRKTMQRTPLLKEIYTLIRIHEIPFSYVPVERLKKFGSSRHQGIVALLSPMAFTPLEAIVQATFEKGKALLILILDGITDIHNIGAIARTASCMGVDALVIPSHGNGSLSGAAMKTSAGALASIPVCRVTNLATALRFLHERGVAVLACYEKASQFLYAIDLKLPIALILGGEGKGIAKEHLKIADHHIAIPMQGPIASLNVSVAAGMVLYEVFRQRLL